MPCLLRLLRSLNAQWFVLNDTHLLCHSGIHIFIVYTYKELSVLWWSRRVLSSLGLTLHIPFHSLFLLPQINILFKQPADTQRRRYVHKSSGADKHNGPHSWHLKSLISLCLLSTRDTAILGIWHWNKNNSWHACLFHLAWNTGDKETHHTVGGVHPVRYLCIASLDLSPTPCLTPATCLAMFSLS